MRPLALRWRISLLVASAILLGMVFAGVTAYVEMDESLVASVDRTLLSMADSALAVPAGEQVDSAAAVGAAVEVSARGQDAVFRVWLDGGAGDVVAGPPGRADLLGAARLSRVKPPEPRGARFFNVARNTRRDYRAIWVRSADAEGTVNVAIALPGHWMTDVLEDFRDGILIAGSAIVLLTIAATTALVRIGLRPISRTASTLNTITDRNVGDAPFDIERTPQELEPFVGAVSEMLVRLSAALDEQKRLVSDASHELRTPLSVARSTVDAALLKPRTPQHYRRALEELREDLERLGALVEEFLVIARLGEGCPGRETETFDLAKVITEVADMFSERAASRGTGLSLALAQAAVCGNRTQIGRLFANLLDNALRHGPAGGTVTVSIEAEDGGTVVVRVQDGGGQIPPESLPHLFDRFYRTDESRARATGGSGLGLSIAREIALRHGGDITATSNPREGTCFTVRLPAA